ncbi:UPF0659 protein [Golovinomyces cichoracearum]|uniref:UPF0659 protein n=1 Tax=Golovinomyces cichoracearum TaxID=62708 RepID=A0A420ITT7_9PEZI|nr:UPF0659 protein [Golovinomyces cichoracearum]
MSSSTRILLFGGHGKVALELTPKLISSSWHVISVIRRQDQVADILATVPNKRSNIETLVLNLEEVKSQQDAQEILDRIQPIWVVWSAGAGDNSTYERTLAIDRDACIFFIRAVIATPTIKKFLLISALSSRRSRAPWIGDECYSLIKRINFEIIPTYYQAKLAADEVLTVLGKERNDDFRYISLRPGRLIDGPGVGKVSLGKTKAKGAVSRADVAEVAAKLLDKNEASGWLDLLDGEEDIDCAIERVLKEGIDCVEGEDLGVMRANVEKLR